MVYDKHQRHFDKLASKNLYTIQWALKTRYARAKKHREKMTLAEEKLWKLLKNKKAMGVYFVAQWVIDPYILDFYAPDLKLAIEIDDPSHLLKKKQLDKERDANLLKKGDRTIRFTNDQVLSDVQAVLDEINIHLKA